VLIRYVARLPRIVAGAFASDSVSDFNVSPIEFALHHSLMFFRPLDRHCSRRKPLGQADAAIGFDKLRLDVRFPVAREFARDGAMADSKLKQQLASLVGAAAHITPLHSLAHEVRRHLFVTSPSRLPPADLVTQQMGHSFSVSGQIRTPAFFPASQSWRSNVPSVISAPTASCQVKADASWTAS
jgi:hypothetical protein